MKNKLAYICSPYRGNAYKRIRNIAYARHITRVALELGYTPITTHLYLPQILNDDIPAQRRRGLRAGKEILETCGTIIIGARYGIRDRGGSGKRYHYHNLGGSMAKWRKSVVIPYFYEEHIQNEKRNIKKQLIQEIAGEVEENKKYAIEIKTAIEDEC